MTPASTKKSITRPPRASAPPTDETGDGLTAKEAQLLAKSEQPLFLIGGGFFSRRAAASSVHKEMTGLALDVESPHPDLSVLSPPARTETAGRSIGIDAVKIFVDRLCLTPYAMPFRIGFVEPASALTVESQNALLRYIEEPTPTTRVILSSRRAEDLIPTLLSRLMLVRMTVRPHEDQEAVFLAQRYGESDETVRKLFEIMDDPDAIQRILEFRLAKNALILYDAISSGVRPESRMADAFLHKRPAGENTVLFVEVVFAAVCERMRVLAESEHNSDSDLWLRLAGKLLVLQTELRYNPHRPVVLAAVLEWLA